MKKHISHSNNLKNLNLIINSDTYKLAHEDIGLLSRNEMRGVRMLLEITKPDLILEENKIISTIIIFGGASITEESNTKKRIKNIEELIKKIDLIQIDYQRLKDLMEINQIEEFASKIKKMSEEHNVSELENWADELIIKTTNFEIDSIEDLLDKYLIIVKELKK